MKASTSRVITQIRNKNLSLEIGLGIAAFVVYVVIDIVASPIYTMSLSLYPPYFLLWQMTLAMFAVLLYAIGRSILIPIWMIVSAWDGFEDGAFYWFQGKPIPDSLPWLTSPLVLQPATPLSIYIGTVISVVLLGVIIAVKKIL